MARRVWTFKPSAADEEIIADELLRLAHEHPGTIVNKSQAIRSLLARGAVPLEAKG